MARTTAERQAAYKARRGRQIAVPLSEPAWARLEALGREWGLSQRETLEKLLSASGGAPSAVPAPVAGEPSLLRQDLARLEGEHRAAWEEVRRLERENTALTIRMIAAERAVENREPTSGTVTGNASTRRRKGGA